MTASRLFVLIVTASLLLASSNRQTGDRYLRIFFVNQFHDSVKVALDNKEIFVGELFTDPATGQCRDELVVNLADSTQRLIITEVKSKLVYSNTIKKGFRYLYIFKIANNYRFDYSNKLSLPE